jgi:hypothetical protein
MSLPKRFIDIPQIEKYFRIEEDGAVWSLRREKYIKPTFNSAGYLYVSLPVPGYNEENMYEFARQYAVHRLVATKYIGQCPEDKETSHKDGNKMNCHWSNLEYITHAQNILKSYSEHSRSKACFYYPRKPFSDATKELMSNAKKKQVLFKRTDGEIIFNSIEDASQSLNTYRKKIYRCIHDNIPFFNKKDASLYGFLSFAPNNNTIKNDPLGK